MEMLWRRRLAVFCFVFVYAGFASIFLTGPVIAAITVGCLLLCALTLLPPLARLLEKAGGVRLVPLLRIALCAAVAAGCFFGVFQWFVFTQTVTKYEGTTAEITAQIRRQQFTTAYEGAYTADIETAEGDTLRVLLTTDNLSLTAGDTVTGTVTFLSFPEFNGSFPARRYYAAQNVQIHAAAKSVSFAGHENPGLAEVFADLRDSLVGILRANLGSKDSALAAALFLGDRSALSDTLNRDFRRLGLSHLLAISGMHFTLLLSGLEKLLSPFTFKKRTRILILAAAAVGYMLLCGLSESVVRAGIMLLLTYAAMLGGRRSDMPTSLGLSALLILVISPASIYSVGLQLSVTAVLALCAFGHITRHLHGETSLPKGRRIARSAAETFLLPVAVQIVLMPLTCLYFGELSLITPISTVLFTPLTELLLLITPFYLLLQVIPPAAWVLGAVIRLTTQATEALAAAFASLRGISISLAYPFAPLWSTVLSGAVLTAPLKKDRRALLRHLGGSAGLFVLFFAVLFCTRAYTAGEVTLHSVSYGKNDAVVITAAGDTMLIDISDGSYGALSAAYAAAADGGAVEVEALFLTHLHSRHLQGVGRLTDTIYVRSLFLPSPETEEEKELHTSLRALAEKKNIRLYVYDVNDAIGWGDNVQILPEARRYIDRSTHPVIALTVQANGTALSYLGTAAEEHGDLTDQSSADILVLGAHGPLRKTEVSLTLSPCLRTVILRADTPQSLPDLPTKTQIYRGGNTVTFRLKP